MKEYELTVLIHPDLEMDIDKPLGKILDTIKEAGGTVTKQDSWGKKKLAYTINKQDFANYVYFELELPADAPLKISKAFNINQEILRYLLVKSDPRVKLAQEAAAAKEAAADTEEETK